MEQFQQEGTAMKKTMKNQSQGLEQIETSLETLKVAKDGFAADTEQMEGLITKLREASSHAFDTLRQSYGGLEGSTNERFGKVGKQFIEAHRVVMGIDSRLGHVERSGARGGGGFGGGKGSGGAMRASNLISIKDVKLPLLTDANPSVAVFRRWWKDLAKYCQRRETHWRGSETLFRVIRGYLY